MNRYACLATALIVIGGCKTNQESNKIKIVSESLVTEESEYRKLQAEDENDLTIKNFGFDIEFKSYPGFSVSLRKSNHSLATVTFTKSTKGKWFIDGSEVESLLVFLSRENLDLLKKLEKDKLIIDSLIILDKPLRSTFTATREGMAADATFRVYPLSKANFKDQNGNLQTHDFDPNDNWSKKIEEINKEFSTAVLTELKRI